MSQPLAAPHRPLEADAHGLATAAAASSSRRGRRSPHGADASRGQGVMTSVIDKLTALLGEEYAKLKGVHREVEFMKDELSSMNALLHRLAEVDRDLDA
ncbi:hypothetical protein ZWY2020_058485 [Hordeum vulgare]|nr:hypothetical protein ZWY2020_058485 [Hordeum vulgare]